MSLPESWVDRIFTKLTVRYGVAFTRQYEGLDIADVKEDWAEVLSGFDGDSIVYAFKYLPADKPPSALQFRDTCRRAPRSDEQTPALEGPKPDPERVARLLERMRAISAKSDPAAVFERLNALKTEGTLTAGQADFLRRAKRGDLSRDADFDGAMFNPIPPEQWPWNQPKEQA